MQAIEVDLSDWPEIWDFARLLVQWREKMGKPVQAWHYNVLLRANRDSTVGSIVADYRHKSGSKDKY